MKQEGVPERTVLRSFQEGLYSDTSNRSRRKPKENVLKASSKDGAFHVFMKGERMDLLKECALSFQVLLEYEYHFVIGRKGQ